ncbi:hypothetical protein [Falsirhodobacter algicola]|uniref:Uncharacterized protein n=1 Tax=Falsirhodobacter algicola TaxID=2692330 RepID=A0A8J8SLS5_9RHOB|nr:hypothetical protein [Falsirhodobacter algicola]QUS36719.1 hypothetical protein GR316_10875 [Falsirhodobacter algicola]
MKRDHPPEIPAATPTSDLPQPAPTLDRETAAMIDTHLRAVDIVRIRVLGDDPAASAPVEAHILAKGLGVEVSLSERMIPPPRNRYVFRYQGRTAILTIAPDMP